MTSPEQPAPADPRPPRSVGSVVRLSLGTDVGRLLAADPVARLGEDPEGVHQARVATRRLRSHLGTYAVVLRGGPAARLARDLKWLGRSLGGVRDLDVLRGRLASAVKGIDPLARGDGLALLARLDEERAASYAALQGVLVSARYRGLLEALGRVVADPPFRGDPHQPAEPVLREVLAGRYRALVDGVAALPPAPADAQLHAVRILAKPVRYAAESAASVLPAPSGRFAKRVTELCDRLGDLNDGVRTSQWLDVAAAEPGRAATVARVRTIEIGRMSDDRRAWPERWARVEETAAELGVAPGAEVRPA